MSYIRAATAFLCAIGITMIPMWLILSIFYTPTVKHVIIAALIWFTLALECNDWIDRNYLRS